MKSLRNNSETLVILNAILGAGLRLDDPIRLRSQAPAAPRPVLSATGEAAPAVLSGTIH